MENQHVRLAALIRPDQQEWLRQQSSPLRPVAAVIRDLIDNLVDNAIRYSLPGSAVTVSCKMRPDGGLLEVEDAGSGIPESEKERIFSRFYRLDHGEPGSGLGLSIVRDIAMDHDAVIQVKPGPDGTGTVFSVLFPLAT